LVVNKIKLNIANLHHLRPPQKKAAFSVLHHSKKQKMGFSVLMLEVDFLRDES